MFLGIREESQEAIIGTSEGVVKAHSLRRKGTHEERWKGEDLDNMVGTPWEPTPGQGEREIWT